MKKTVSSFYFKKGKETKFIYCDLNIQAYMY